MSEADTQLRAFAPQLSGYIGSLISRFDRDISKIVLFGSRAMGTARANSDYDIAIFVSHSDSLKEARREASRLTMAPLVREGLDIRPVVLRQTRWDEKSEFLLHIRTHGRVLYDARNHG